LLSESEKYIGKSELNKEQFESGYTDCKHLLFGRIKINHFSNIFKKWRFFGENVLLFRDFVSK